MERRIRELEVLAAAGSLEDTAFETLRQVLSGFRTCVDDLSVEEKRTAIRTVVRRVVWDGVNAHAVLVGAEEETAVDSLTPLV